METGYYQVCLQVEKAPLERRTQSAKGSMRREFSLEELIGGELLDWEFSLEELKGGSSTQEAMRS